MASAAYTKFCEDVKAKTDIVELIIFRDAGKNLFPFWRCEPVCDVIDFVQQWQNVDFNGAIDILAERIGMKWGGNGSGGKLDEETQKEMTRYVERRWVEKLATDAATYYHSRLTPEIRAWLKKFYGFDDDIIDRQQIGWADGSLPPAGPPWPRPPEPWRGMTR